MQPLVISNSRWRYLLLLLVSLGFVAGGLFILRTSKTAGESWSGWASVVFFGACSAVCIQQLFDLHPRITINDQGVDDRTLGVGIIPWSEITNAYVKSIKGNDFVCLVVRDPNMWIGRLSPMRKAMMKANKALGFTELNINLSGTGANTQQIHELILKLSASSQKTNL